MIDKLDTNDIAFATKRHNDLIGGIAAPNSNHEKINPHVTTFVKKDGAFVSVFHVKPIYYHHITGAWRPMDEVASYYGNHKVILKEGWDSMMKVEFLNWLMKRMELIDGQVLIPSPYKVGETVRIDRTRILFTETTFYPDPHPETTTVDGVCNVDNSSSWDTSHDNTSASNVNDSSPNLNDGAWGGTANLGKRGSGQYLINRGFTLFDTSSIDDGDTIDSADFSGYVFATNENNGYSYILVQCSPSSNTAIAAADFDDCGAVDSPTAGSTSRLITSFTASQYDDTALNATGLGWIEKTGVTKIGHRIEEDDDTAPSWTTSTDWVQYYSADASGTSTDPKLVVTHSAAATFTPRVIMF